MGQLVEPVTIRDRERSVLEDFVISARIRSADGSWDAATFFLPSVAVGTALASGPPHRSVREELPHTALASGSCDDQPLVLVVRTTTPVTRIPALGPAQVGL